MDLSISLFGLQSAAAPFDSAAKCISQAFSGIKQTRPGAATNQGDSVELSTAVGGLLNSKFDFVANEKVALVENRPVSSTL